MRDNVPESLRELASTKILRKLNWFMEKNI